MKKYILHTLFGIMLTAAPATASAQCPTATAEGVNQNGIQCFVKDQWSSAKWAFRNYEEFQVGPINAEIDSIRIDSINFLPCGIQWTTSNAARQNRFSKLEEGCFILSGVTTDPVGQYNPKLWITAWLGGDTTPVSVESRLGDLRIYANVITAGSTCPNINTDTTTANNMEGTCRFTGDPLGLTDFTSVNELENVSKFSNSPNPFSTTTLITFTAQEANKYAFKVYDVTGKVVHSNDVTVTTGVNTITFDRKGLGAGVYFYSLTNGTSVISNKMVITQ